MGFLIEVIFKKAEISDIERLIKLHEASFAGDTEAFSEEAWNGYFCNYDNVLNAINNHIAFKIMTEDKIIGDIFIKICSDHQYYIWLFSIFPEYQNMGVGSKALRFLEEYFTNARMFTLVTPKQKPRNCHFYEKNGFKQVFEEVVSDRYTKIGYAKIM